MGTKQRLFIFFSYLCSVALATKATSNNLLAGFQVQKIERCELKKQLNNVKGLDQAGDAR